MKKYLISLFAILAVFIVSACNHDINPPKQDNPSSSTEEEIITKPIPNRDKIDRELFSLLREEGTVEPGEADVFKSIEETDYFDSFGKPLYSFISEVIVEDNTNPKRSGKYVINSEILEILKKGDVIVEEKESVYILEGKGELSLRQQEEFAYLREAGVREVNKDSFVFQSDNHLIGNKSYKVIYSQEGISSKDGDTAQRREYEEITFSPRYQGVSSFKLWYEQNFKDGWYYSDGVCEIEGRF